MSVVGAVAVVIVVTAAAAVAAAAAAMFPEIQVCFDAIGRGKRKEEEEGALSGR